MITLDVCGIVAEHDPLHNGHVYHISKTRSLGKFDAIICVISSHFTQRGEPAMIGKLSRARMALDAGADLVLELPVIFSCANAGVFADAGVDIIAATGVARAISFGMETPGGVASAVAREAAHESERYRELLRAGLSRGMSFVSARAQALDAIVPGAAEVLRGPNNTLGISYMKRIYERGLPIDVITIERSGAPHGGEADGERGASAGAIRAMARGGRARDALRHMPPTSADAMMRDIKEGHAVIDMDLYWRALRIVMLRSANEELEKTAGMGEGFESRMARAAKDASSYDDFIDACSCRRYTRGRVARYAAHLLLGIDRRMSEIAQSRGPEHIRVLGANEVGRDVLREMKERATLPICTRPNAHATELSAMVTSLEHRAADIWETLTARPRPRAEQRGAPVML